MTEMQKKISRNFQQVAMVAMAVFAIVVIAIVVCMNVKNNREMQGILEDSIEGQLLSISMAARELIDTDAFERYNSLADVETDEKDYVLTRMRLRQLADNVGAQYIYALKMIDGKAYFVFDTDPEDEEVFIEYELAPVHERAFAGTSSADVMNVSDEWGSYNTGAVPIWKDGIVVGIVSTDIEDTHLSRSNSAARLNAWLLIITLAVALGVMFFFLLRLTHLVRRMQESLVRMAHYDRITGLPNRQYLLEYLEGITGDGEKEPFALLFIDLDNFKSVNDGAGHDAGDELLRHIAEYLEQALDNAKAFRPSPGILNIAARIGGDEFVQVVSGVHTREQAEKTAQHLLDGFATQEIDRYIEKYQVGLSIGIALYPYHTHQYHVLIKYADIAMYEAKRGGKNQYRVYTDEMHDAKES